MVIGALLAAGCGGGGKKPAATTVPSTIGTTVATELPTTTTEAVTTTAGGTSSSGAPTDLAARAKAAVLQDTDFPPGFPAQPDDPTQGLGIEKLWGELASCLSAPRAQPAAHATSPTFKRGIATQGRSTVEYTTEASATAIQTELAGPKLAACAQQSFTADLNRSKPDGSTPGAVAVAKRAFAPIGTAKIFALRINASVHLADLEIKLFQDFFVISKGGALIRMFFLNPGAEFPQDLERSLVEKVVGRA